MWPRSRLYSRAELNKGNYHFDSPQLLRPLYEDTPPKPASPRVPPTYSLAPAVSSEDMVTLSSQLLSQAKMITSLHQAIGRLERDRDLHVQRIQSLEEEVRRLAAVRGDVTESLLDRRMEGLRQEMSCELRHLQDMVRETPRVASPSLRSTSSILQEVNENKRLLWKEYESLRRDSDYLHQRLRRQEDDVLRQISDGQELKRAQERNACALEGLLSTHQMQTQELSRTRTDTQSVQRDLLQIRSAIGDLKEEVRILEGKVSVRPAKADRAGPPRSSRKPISKSPSLSSLEDAQSQLSLADISSEDTSCSLSSVPPAVSRGSRDKSRSGRKSHSDLSNSNPSDDDLDELSDSPPELNFSDL
ncbi:uncharacterized protein LOC120923002 [Rana temporaria]|uniref:uncharacterized protein LOC120923002 n=1 Tax=Rana temporaria TaxID=8407 RepID=UPI001AAD601B|nr:uncharacterized protein LOC120923002 [Rana temporaria]